MFRKVPRGTSKNKFTHPGMSMGPHNQKVGAQVIRPHQ